jgi:DUF4097 and DUF4098 domain-containing protein YvlB
MKLSMKGGRVIIDGREFTGSSFNITNGKVTVDGVIQCGELVGDINIQVFGDVQQLENTSGTVTVSGNSGNIKTVSGDVEVKGTAQDIQTVSGDVSAKSAGNIKTVSGDIRH